MNKVKVILQYIKDNSGCDSYDLDCHIVHSLYEDGMIRADDGTSSSSQAKYEYSSIEITGKGLEYLKSLNPSFFSGWFFKAVVGAILATGSAVIAIEYGVLRKPPESQKESQEKIQHSQESYPIKT